MIMVVAEAVVAGSGSGNTVVAAAVVAAAVVAAAVVASSGSGGSGSGSSGSGIAVVAPHQMITS